MGTFSRRTIVGSPSIGIVLIALFVIFFAGRNNERAKKIEAQQYSLWIKITRRDDITFEEWKMLPDPLGYMEVYQK